MIIASYPDDPLPIGHTILVDFDRRLESGEIVTFRNQPVHILRQATQNEYIAEQLAIGGDPFSRLHEAPWLYFDVSTD